MQNLPRIAPATGPATGLPYRSDRLLPAAVPERRLGVDRGVFGAKQPLRGAMVLGASSVAELSSRLEHTIDDAAAGLSPWPSPPADKDLRAPERVAIDYEDALDLGQKAACARQALAADSSQAWRALRASGVYRGRGRRPPVAFLYTGQGSQYVNMLRGLRDEVPVVAATFAEADRVLLPLLGERLSDVVFADPADPAAVACAARKLDSMTFTQPAILTVDTALTRLLGAYGIEPDMVMGHSLGEYAALVAAGALSFADALRTVSARERDLASISLPDHGRMAAVAAPLPLVEQVLRSVEGYIVIANYNSRRQAVIGGESAAVEAALAAFATYGITARRLPVSHAFHTSIVEPACGPLRRTLGRLELRPPSIPVVTNVSGGFYPAGANAAAAIVDVLTRQVASPVQFTKGLQTLHEAGARVFVEVGPKKALQGLAEDVFAGDCAVTTLFANHPRLPDATAFNHALCGLYANGAGRSLARGNFLGRAGQ